MRPSPFIPWAVIFDVDGTMVDNHAYHEEAWLELGRRRGLPITRDYYRTRIHSNTNDAITRGLLGEDSDPALRTAIAAEKESLYREIYRPRLQPLPGLLTWLQMLATAGIPCAVASNSPAGNVDLVLDVLKLRAQFEVAITGDDLARGKPAPDIFLLAAQRLGVTPARCLVFEDSTAGFTAAQHAGMRYVAICADSTAPTAPPAAAQAALVVPDFAGLTLPRAEALLA